MPLALDPNQTTWISLDIDKDKPDDTRPAFRCRFLSQRQALQVEQLTDDAVGEKDLKKKSALLDEALSVGVNGWRNMTDEQGNPIDFTLEGLRVLTERERITLAYKTIYRTRLLEYDRKNSESPSQSSAAVHVPSAGTESAANPVK